jgi:hypothetical protein
MGVKNYYYLSRDVEYLNRLAGEYRYLGRECQVIVSHGEYPSELVVFARPKPKGSSE